METFPHYWPFVRGIHMWLRGVHPSPMDSPGRWIHFTKDQWCGALMFLFSVNFNKLLNKHSRFLVWDSMTFVCLTWWRHQMETFSALLAICAGNSLVPGEFPAQRPVTRSFGVFFDLRLNKRLSKQSWGWWFEKLSRPLWRHRNDIKINNTTLVICYMIPTLGNISTEKTHKL